MFPNDWNIPQVNLQEIYFNSRNTVHISSTFFINCKHCIGTNKIPEIKEFNWSRVLKRYTNFPPTVLYDCALISTLLLDTFKCTVSVSTKYVKSQSQSHVTTNGQSASLFWCQAPPGAYDQIFIFVGQLQVCRCRALPLTRGWVCCIPLLLVLPAHSPVRVPLDSWPYLTFSDSRLHQPGGPGRRIYNPQEQGGPVITPGTAFPFRRLLRFAGLRWKYSNPPPRGDSTNCTTFHT
jgi:hypothetical protein